MKTALERILIASLMAMTAVTVVLLLLLRETWGGYPSYPPSVLSLSRQASAGDVAAALKAWKICSNLPTELDRIDQHDINYDTIGICSNFKYLYIENAIYNRDEVAYQIGLNLLRESYLPGFDKRIDLYEKIAKSYFGRNPRSAPYP